MSTHIFSSEEMGRLSKNPCVVRCRERSITYTHEFKKRALEQYAQGISTKEIWRRAGFDISAWKKDYTKDCLKSWKRIIKKGGLEGLARAQGAGATGRTKTKGLTDADKIKRLELQVKYLKAENDFLAKLRARRAESISGQKKNSGSSGK
jgi:transposase-like protein